MNIFNDLYDREHLCVINSEDEYQKFITRGFSRIGVNNVVDYDEAYKRFVGPVNQKPSEYPYLVSAYYNDERSVIEPTFVPIKAFVINDPDAKEFLYEFTLKITSRVAPYSTRETFFHTYAKDPFEAHILLGQTYDNVDDYEVEVVSWVCVK